MPRFKMLDLLPRVLRAASIVHQVPEQQIRNGSREGHIVEARMMAMCILVSAGKPSHEVAKYFGKDRTTVIYAKKAIENLLEQSAKIRERYTRMEALL